MVNNKSAGGQNRPPVFVKKPHTIKLNRDFTRLYSRGRSAVGGYLAVYMLPNRRGFNRVGFAVGKRYGNAVMRNRIKRLMRESYRGLCGRLNGAYDIIIVAKNRAAGKGYAQISRDMEYIFNALEIL